MKERHVDNVYALNLQDDEVFIDDSESGRKGYACMGCKRQMEAVISKITNRRSYFRHVVKANEDGKKCTYSDETYRHKMAKEILQDKKRIKVPAVYKFPPKGNDGWPNLISEAKFIEAQTVGIERSFYEDENGKISFGKNDKPEGKYLLIRPDVTFFDKDEKPILFIELVATHKVTDDKKIKIKRLGIDTVQVSIPKDSLEAIGKAFNKSNRTKWLYNYEQENTQYIPVTTSDSEGIQSIDQEQRKLLEESYKCRTAQIRNLIRSIGRCLGSEYYKQVEQQVRSEISRVEGNTEKCEDEWRRICKDRRSEIKHKCQSKTEKFRSEKSQLEKEENKFQEDCSDLEGRYIRKAEELEREAEEIRETELMLNGSETEIAESIAETEIGINKIIEEQRRIESEIAHFEQYRDQVRTGFEYRKRESVDYFERAAASERKEIEGIEEHIRTSPEKYRIKEEDYSKQLEEEGRRGLQELSDRNRECIREIQDGKAGKDGYDREIAKKIKNFDISMAILENMPAKYHHRERIQESLKAARSGAYKNWNK